MYRNAFARRILRRTVLSAAALAALALTAAPAAAVCTIFGGANWVGVELMEPPSSSSGLTATQRTIMRREHAHVSSALANMLALQGLIDSDPFAPNPQVRVVIEDPSSIDGRQSFAIFTVTEIFDNPDVRIRVFEQGGAGDQNSGEYKLFADRLASGGVRQFGVFDGGFLDGTLVGVKARVLIVPTSSSSVSGGTSSSRTYCEDAAYFFKEEAVVAPGAEVALLAPHGGIIERRTSEQLDALEGELANQGVVANVWDVQGDWGRGQTDKRLHITAPAIYPDSFPGLRQLMAKSDHAAGIPFRFSVALHGYADDDHEGIILGGRASREAKCLVAERIRDELEAARGDRAEIGFRINHPNVSDLVLAASCDTPGCSGYVPPDKLSGLSEENLVNRLSPNPSGAAGWGGIQLEQSTVVRTDETNPGDLSQASDGWLRNVVARGVAQALVELIAYDDDQGPTGICANLD